MGGRRNFSVAAFLAAVTAACYGGPNDTLRGQVEGVARRCDTATLMALKPLSKAEKDLAIVRSWEAMGQAADLVYKALVAMDGKATWFGPEPAERTAEQEKQQVKTCQGTFQAIVADGGDINLTLFEGVTADMPGALQYLLDLGADPTKRLKSYGNATYGMLALKNLSRFDFKGREDDLKTFLDALVSRMGRLKGLKDERGRPVVYYALGLDPLISFSPNQKTVDAIIKAIAAAGADVGTPWKLTFVSGEERAFNLYRGTDPEVLALLRPH